MLGVYSNSSWSFLLLVLTSHIPIKCFVDLKHLAYTGLYGGLEHLKVETRLINERFTSVMGECVT